MVDAGKDSATELLMAGSSLRSRPGGQLRRLAPSHNRPFTSALCVAWESAGGPRNFGSTLTPRPPSNESSGFLSDPRSPRRAQA